MGIKITNREVLFSIAIISVMLAIGFSISGRIDSYLDDRYAEYNTAVQIDGNAEMFGYGMRTSVGNAFVYGDLVAVDPVSIRDIDGKYGRIIKQKQKHTRHTRTETYTDSKGHTHTRTVVYWTWDDAGSWYWNCKTIAFLGFEFPYGTIGFPNTEYLTTVYESASVRYQYHVCATEYMGTIYARLANGTVTDAHFYQSDIAGTIKALESRWQKALFWVAWCVLMVAGVIIFYYFDNKWLE